MATFDHYPESKVQLSVPEVADLLSVSGKTVYRWVKQGRLPAYRLGHQLRFNRSELLEWAAENRVSVTPQGVALEQEGPPPSVAEALRAGGVRYRVGGETKEDALGAAVDTLHLPDHIEREFALEVLLARESLASTGLGGGIAIPHVRNPATFQVTQAAITLCFLEHAVDFDSVDGIPVDKLLILTSPTLRVHLSLLGRLTHLLRDSEIQGTLARVATRKEIFGVFGDREVAICAKVRSPIG